MSNIDAQYPINQDVNAVVDRQIQILDEYEKQFSLLLKAHTHLSKLSPTVDQLESNFYLFVCRYSSFSDKKIRDFIKNIFAKLNDENFFLSFPITELHKCQNQLFARANLKIDEAKFEVKMLKVVYEVYESYS